MGRVAPLGHFRRQDPDGPAQRAAQVDDGGAHRHHQVQRADEGGGFVVVVDGLLIVGHGHACGGLHGMALGVTGAVLQVDEAAARCAQDGHPRRRGHGAALLQRAFGAAAPGDAHVQAVAEFGAQFRAPVRRPFGVCPQVALMGGEVAALAAEQAR